MHQCRNCGANVPENSQHCLQCGREVHIEREDTPPAKELEFLKPAITGGLAMGVLSSIPLVNIGNVVCCLWVQAGGGLTTWLLNRQRPRTLRYGDGALGGVISGVIGAVVSTVINIPIQMIMFTPERVAQVQAQLSQLPPAAQEMLSQFLQPGFNLYRTLISLAMTMLVYGLFGMIGGMITVAIVNREKLD